jgi:hypothetical protein
VTASRRPRFVVRYRLGGHELEATWSAGRLDAGEELTARAELLVLYGRGVMATVTGPGFTASLATWEAATFTVTEALAELGAEVVDWRGDRPVYPLPDGAVG